VRSKARALVTLSTATSVLAALGYYATRAKQGDSPIWLSSWAVTHRPTLAEWLLGLTVLSAITEWIRAIWMERLENKRVLQRLLDDFSTRQFRLRSRKNRLTLFRAVPGWRAYLLALRRLPLLGKRHKWKALWRTKFGDTYLVVFLRASDSRSPKSAVALRVSDHAASCVGMAGLAWEENFCFKGNLVKPNPDEVRRLRNWDSVPATHPIRQYAEETNVKDIVLLASVDNFARHFMGTLIRRADGKPWGVLLLDSEDEACPFTTNTTGGAFGQRFNALAGLLGKFVG
jgi:hypothetical protein